MKFLNVTYKDRRELSLNISLEEVLTADIVYETTVIGDKMNRVSGS